MIELLTIKEVADMLKISVSGMRRLQYGRHIPFIKVGGITQDMYDRLVLENKARQAEILEKMGKHNVADKTFYITANRIFKAVQRAREIFESSEADEKRDFLNMLLQNATLDGKRLEFTVRSPFQTIYETRNQPIGLRG